MNKQEIFDAAYIGVVKQGEPALIDTTFGGCAYRSDNNKMCAAAHVVVKAGLPNNHPWWESAGAWNEVVGDLPLGIREEIGEDNERFMMEIQSAHDDAAINLKERRAVSGDMFINAYKANMNEVAKHHQLEVPVVYH